MEKFILKLALGLGLLLSLGCGKAAEEEAADSIDDFVTTGNITRKAGTSEYTGSGVMRFSKTLASSQSSLGWSFRAELLDTSSRIEIVTFASRTDLSDGLHFVLVPSGQTLAGSLELNGTGPRTVAGSRLVNFNSTIAMILDFHGYGSTARVVGFRSGVTNSTAYDFDSDRLGDLSAPLPASPLPGVLYGLILNNVRVISGHAQNTLTAR